MMNVVKSLKCTNWKWLLGNYVTVHIKDIYSTCKN